MKPKTSDLIKNPDKSFVLTVTLDQKTLLTEKNHVLVNFQAEFETKGFRKGKAPLDVVEANISPSALIEEVLSHSLSHIYQDKLKEYDLKPITDPQIDIKNPPLTWDKSWTIEIKSCELPEIKLKESYKQAITKINKSDSKDDQKMDLSIKSLLDNSTVDLPKMLVDSDLQKQLSNLVDQVQQSGLTMDQYLKSKNENIKDYTAKVEAQIRQEWQLNLCISQIAITEKLDVKKEEVDVVIQKQPDLAKNPNIVYYLLTQQKVFDFLKKL